MYKASDLFKQYLSQSNREFEIRAEIDGVIYDNTSVIEFEIEDGIIPSEEFTIGTVISDKLTISIKTTDTIVANAQVSPSVRMKGIGGYTEWMPLGAFYVDSRDFKNDVWTFTCYDRLILAQQDYVSSLIFPVAMQTVWDEIVLGLDTYIPISQSWPFDFTVLGDELSSQPSFLLDFGVEIDSSFMIPYKPGDFTTRDMMGYIASAHASSIKMTREEQLSFIEFLPEAEITPLQPSDFFRSNQTNPFKNYTRLLLTYNTDGETLETGAGDDDHTLKFYNPFMDQAMLDKVYDVISGQGYVPLSTNWPFDLTVVDDEFSITSEFSYAPMSMDWRGRPDLDVGDLISVTQRDGSKFQSILLSNKLSFKGGLKESSAAPSYSPQRSEFDYKGSLKGYINQKTKNAIQLDIPYYGVTIGKANGLKIERSDGVTKATFNSDKLEILKNATPVFSVDANGDLNIMGKITLAAGSSIDWNVVGAPSAAQVGARPNTWMPTASEVGARPNTWTPTAADVGALATTWVGTTHIDAFGLYTGAVNANQINVGTLTGFTIQTASSGDRLVLNSSALTSYASGYTAIKLSPSQIEFWGSGGYAGYHAGKILGAGAAMQLEADSAFIFYTGGAQRLNLASGTSFLFSDLSMSGSIYCGNLISNYIKGWSNSNIVYVGNNGCYIEAASDGLRLHFNSNSYFYINSTSAYAVVNGTWYNLAV